MDLTAVESRLQSNLAILYGPQAGDAVYPRLMSLLERHARRRQSASRPEALTQRDAILITYGDQFQEPGVAPLQTLEAFCKTRLSHLVSGVHILPFFPSSSDDGFSVIDYRKVDPALGSWDDIHRLASDFRLMVDGVVNHISAHSDWFKGFLNGDPRFANFFICPPADADLSRVVRPRALPLLTAFQTASGERRVWTTFSADQIDLNYDSPEVLLEMVDLLLDYVAHGAQILRLDAIAYLWKQFGTNCIHLPQTHAFVRLLRAVLDLTAPGVLLITETNVAHAENISYFGNGADEAHLVYNFALPPLVLHAFLSGNAEVLSQWAAGIEPPSPQTAFFNFLASHDGIGLNPARGILADGEIDALVGKIRARGGLISSKTDPGGAQSPYELNVNYYDALNDPAAGEPLDLQADRFIASQAILLSLAGLPGIYVHSLMGSRGWPQGVQRTGRNRSINRRKFVLNDLLAGLDDPASRRGLIFRRYAGLLRARASSAAFDPHGRQQVSAAGPGVFALLRRPPGRDRPVLCLHNVRAELNRIKIDLAGAGLQSGRWRDLISGQSIDLSRFGEVAMQPYQVLWLEEAGDSDNSTG